MCFMFDILKLRYIIYSGCNRLLFAPRNGLRGQYQLASIHHNKDTNILRNTYIRFAYDIVQLTSVLYAKASAILNKSHHA